LARKSNLLRNNESGVATSVLPMEEWGSFLETFGRMHRGWMTRLETKDTVTKECVVTHEMPLQTLELDLEDERNPRINVIVKVDNKTIKHILFLPSQMVLRTSTSSPEESLQIETLNTETTVYVRPPDS